MLKKIANHFRLVLRLIRDKRVRFWLKFGLIVIPAIYAVIPLGFDIPDFIPLVGLIDDILLAAICTWVFTHVAPRSVVEEHMAQIQGTIIPCLYQNIDLETLRNPQEVRDLGIGFVIILASLLAVGYSGGLILALSLAVSWFGVKAEQKRLLSSALLCGENQLPEVYSNLQAVKSKFPEINVLLFVSQNATMNAYTFGLSEPYSIVLTSSLVKNLTDEEIQAVIGHEYGHILFHHVSLINIVTQSTLGLEKLFFYKWSRSSEYSADRIGLISSDNNPTPLSMALIKLGSGIVDRPIDMEAFMNQTGSEKEKSGTNFEYLSTHPFIRNRILGLRMAATAGNPACQPVTAAEAIISPPGATA